jgi:hypothetical protein
MVAEYKDHPSVASSSTPSLLSSGFVVNLVIVWLIGESQESLGLSTHTPENCIHKLYSIANAND